MPRQTLEIPFGGGLDRLSGTAVIDPSSHVDLRNVHLGPGRMELRRGLGNAAAVGWGTDVINITPVKKTGLEAVIVYDSVSRDIRLYSTDGATFSNVGTLFTVPSAVAGHVPRVSVAELYAKIIIAHDEPLYTHRQKTRVFDVTESTLTDLKLNLDRVALDVVRFRGVAKHLAYLIAWGAGPPSDADRPETLWISLPGDPLTIQPEHYFLVGSPSDPILAGRPLTPDDPSQSTFVVAKSSELWGLVGYDRQTFGMRPLDSNFGLYTSRAHVEVNGEFFFWSLHGPRSTRGGASGDLAMPLDLGGVLPDASAAANDNMFAWYDPTENEVVFCFGTFGYVLHLNESPRRWSYRQFGLELNSAGLLFSSTGTGKLNPIVPTIGTVTTTAPAYTPGNDNPTFTVPWTLSAAGTTEIVEVWGRHELFGKPGHFVRGVWTLLGTALASAGTKTVEVPHYMTSYELAIRVISSSTPGAGFTGPPDTWPATARATKVSAGAITSFAIDGIWERRSPTEHGQPFAYVGPGASGAEHPELSFVYEQSTDGGGSWQQHAAGTYPAPITGSMHANDDRLLDIKYRLTVVGPSATAGPTLGTSTATLAPEAPTITSIGADAAILNELHLHPIFVEAGAHGGSIEVRARHDPDGTWSNTYTVPSGQVEAIIFLDNTGGADDVRAEAVTRVSYAFGPRIPFGGQLSIDDFSKTTVATESFP